MDKTNRAICGALLKNGRATLEEVAEQVGRAKSSVRDRIKKMEREGTIQGYRTVVEPAALGYRTSAFVFCNLPFDGDKTLRRVMAEPGVVEVLFVTGERRVIVHVRAADNRHLRHLVNERLIPLGVTDVESRVIMDRFPGREPTEEPAHLPPRSLV